MKKILFVLGTRAELIKMAPIMHELEKRSIPYFFIHTGQHSISDLVKSLGVKSPDVSFDNPSVLRGRFGASVFNAVKWGFGVFFRIRREVKRVSPSVVLVHGDTMTTALATLACSSIFFNRPMLCHVEAGLRSGSLFEPFPEEISRRITDFFSDVLFAPTNESANNLRKELGFRKRKIVVTGNTNMDVLFKNLPKARFLKTRIPRKPFVFAQMHRHENISNRERSKAFVETIVRLPCRVVLVAPLNTRKKFQEYGLMKVVEKAGNVEVHDNLPYLVFLRVFSNSCAVITDGGGEIEEASALRIPCIVFREKSERREAEKAGVAVRVGSDSSKAIDLVNQVLSRKGFYKKAVSSKNPFGDGRASERIVDFIQSLV